MTHPTPDSSATPLPAADHAYFFMGNCQTQYLCSMIGAVSHAPRYMLGQPFNVNVTLDGARVPYVKGKDFQAGAREMLAQGGRTILVVQETSKRRYAERVGGWKALFTDILPVPHLHYRALWPGRSLNKPIEEVSDKNIRRVFDWERHEFKSTLHRAGMSDEAITAFMGPFWDANRQGDRFFHPGHPTGAAFADVLQALGPAFAERLPCFEPLIPALRRSLGIYQTSSHPIADRVVEVQDLPWGRTELYQAWIGLRFAEPETLRAAIDRATVVLDTPALMAEHAWPVQAHFRGAVGKANLQLERKRRALSQITQAAVELKGFHPLMRIALNQAARSGRHDLVEHMLVAVAPFVVGFRPETGGFADSLKELHDKPAGRVALGRVMDQTDGDSWIHRQIQALATAAA